MYAIADGHYTGDAAPYAFVTTTSASTRPKCRNGLPAGEWVRSIRPDIRNRNIVYLGSEEGIFLSFDAGAHWQAFRDLPPVSVHDIRMQQQADDLVIATHGRAVYIMDDMAPVQQLQQAVARGSWLFPAAPLVRVVIAPIRRGRVHKLRSVDRRRYWHGGLIASDQTATQKAPPKTVPNRPDVSFARFPGTQSGKEKAGPQRQQKAGPTASSELGIDGPSEVPRGTVQDIPVPAFRPVSSVRLTFGSTRTCSDLS